MWYRCGTAAVVMMADKAVLSCVCHPHCSSVASENCDVNMSVFIEFFFLPVGDLLVLGLSCGYAPV